MSTTVIDDRSGFGVTLFWGGSARGRMVRYLVMLERQGKL